MNPGCVGFILSPIRLLTPPQNVVYCTINLRDVDMDTLKYDLTPTGLSFKASAGSYVRDLHPPLPCLISLQRP